MVWQMKWRYTWRSPRGHGGGRRRGRVAGTDPLLLVADIATVRRSGRAPGGRNVKCIGRGRCCARGGRGLRAARGAEGRGCDQRGRSVPNRRVVARERVRRSSFKPRLRRDCWGQCAPCDGMHLADPSLRLLKEGARLSPLPGRDAVLP